MRERPTPFVLFSLSLLSSFLARVYYVTFFSVLVVEEEERGIRERERNEMEKSSGEKEEKIRYVGSLKILLSGVFFFDTPPL